MKRVLTVIGARPQWMKASALSRVLKDARWEIEERVLHTGQHYSTNMAGQFIEELGLPEAHHTLSVSSDPPVRMGQMMEGIARAIESDRPDAVLLYGDTDSTLAGAWAASRAGVPVVHIEAGLRSFDRRMPEEVNRILTDALSDVLFCPSQQSVEWLRQEGIANGVRPGVRVEVSGDLMLDTARQFGGALEPVAAQSDSVLLTLHRPSNVDDVNGFVRWMDEVGRVAMERRWKVRFPVHPRTAQTAEKAWGAEWKDALAQRGIEALDPMGYVDMLHALKTVQQVWTDSGGLQKEAFFMGRPAVILRDTSEWKELLAHGVARLCPAPEALAAQADALERDYPNMAFDQPLYGNGQAATYIAQSLKEWLNR